MLLLFHIAYINKYMIQVNIYMDYGHTVPAESKAVLCAVNMLLEQATPNGLQSSLYSLRVDQ